MTRPGIARESGPAQWGKDLDATPRQDLSASAHNLKHTFGRRLHAADVPKEDRKMQMGSETAIPSHYSTMEITELIGYASRIAAPDTSNWALTMLKR